MLNYSPNRKAIIPIAKAISNALGTKVKTLPIAAIIIIKHRRPKASNIPNAKYFIIPGIS